MLSRLRALNPGKSTPAILYYWFVRTLAHLLMVSVYRFRLWGRERVPASGPLLVVLNHQSHLDPILAGIAVRPRHLNFMARSTLFKAKAFSWLITSLNSVPLKQGAPDTAAIRTALDLLAQGRCVMIFPEGTRTGDGSMHRFKKGAWLLMSRAKCRVLPVAIEGCYDVWKRGTPRPKLLGRQIAAMVGEPIEPDTLLAMGHEQGLAHLATVIDAMRAELANRLAKAGQVVTTRPRVDTEEE